MAKRNPKPHIEGQMPLMEGGHEYAGFAPYLPDEAMVSQPLTSAEGGVPGPYGSSSFVVDVSARNRNLRDFLHYFNRAQKGAGIARAEASHPAIDEVETGYEHGVAGVQARHEINQGLSRDSFERACRVCPFAGSCALRSRFGAIVRPENLGKASERNKFTRILDKDSNQRCYETLETIKSKRRPKS